MGAPNLNEQLDQELKAVQAAAGKEGEDDEMELDLKGLITGRTDSLRNTVLTMVASSRFKAAAKELAIYREIKSELYILEKLNGPMFERAIECVKKIEDLKKIPDFESKPYSFRSHVNRSVLANFDLLTTLLKKIETTENNVKVQDIHSTVWVGKAFMLCLTLSLAALAIKEANRSLGSPVEVLASDISNFLFNIVGL